MKIYDLKTEKKDGLTTAVATVLWEDCDRPRREIFFSTTDEYSQDLLCNPHSFLVASILPAMRHGEKRIKIDAEICPELQDGLATAMAWISHWSDDSRIPMQIEAKTLSGSSVPNKQKRAGLFFSGGIDSLFSLRFNRNNFPIEHPGAVKDCIFILGGDIGGLERHGSRIEYYNRLLDTFIPIAQDAGVNLIPIYTNARHLDDDGHFWLYEYHGSFLAAIAHVLTKRLTDVFIGSTYDIPHMHALGSHPLLDPNYGSADLRIRHDAVRFSRFDKTKAISEWEIGLQNIRACTGSEGDFNCGKCEKCIRTMTALLALGVLDKTRAFNEDDVTQDLLGTVRFKNAYQASCYQDLIDPLMDKGRSDLVKVIRNSLKRKKAREFDQKYLNGNIMGIKDYFRAKGKRK